MKDRMLQTKKALIRLILTLALAVMAGAMPGEAFISHANTETAASVEAGEVAAAETEDDGTTFMLAFFGGIILLILFVVVVVVAVASSTAGVVGAQEDE